MTHRRTTRPAAERDVDAIAAIAPDPVLTDVRRTPPDDDGAFLQTPRTSHTTMQIPIVPCTGALREVRGLENRLAELRVRGVLKRFDIKESGASPAITCCAARLSS